jgi:hypothetical protein
MGRTRARKPVSASLRGRARTQQPETKSVPWWKKSFVRVGTLIVAALGTAITAWLQPQIASWLDRVFERGEPVSVHASVKLGKPGDPVGMTDFYFPPTKTLSATDVELLSTKEPDEQMSWLAGNGGIPLGPRWLELRLKGNRNHLVRVTDMRAESKCDEKPRGGTLVRVAPWGTGAASGSIQISLDVGRPGAKPLRDDPKDNKIVEPYFPAQTIVLQDRTAEDLLALTLASSSAKLCQVEIELTVLDGDKEVPQRILPDAGQPAAVLGRQESPAQYGAIYLAGNICKRVVLAPENYRPSLEEKRACGPGNARPPFSETAR